MIQCRGREKSVYNVLETLSQFIRPVWETAFLLIVEQLVNSIELKFGGHFVDLNGRLRFLVGRNVPFDIEFLGIRQRRPI